MSYADGYVTCGEWCLIFEPKGECVCRDPGEHCSIVLAAKVEARAEEGANDG